MSFLFRSNLLPSLLKRRHHHHLRLLHANAAPKRSLVRPIAAAAAVASAAAVAYISYTSSGDRPMLSLWNNGCKDDARGAFYLMLLSRDAELVNELISSGHIPDAIDVPRMMAERPHMAAGWVLHDAIVQGAVDIDGVTGLFDELKRQYTVCDRAVHSSLRGYEVSIMGVSMIIDPPPLVCRLLFNKKMEEMAMERCLRMLDWGFYQSMLDPTTLNALLRDLLEQGDDRVAVANKLFDKMLESHNPPSLVTVNAETCNIMVNQRFKEGRVEEAVEIFHRLGEKEKGIDVGCLDNLVGKLQKNGRASDAKKLYNEMPMVSVRTCDYGSMIAHSFREGKWEDALDYFGKMLHAREGFDLRLYTKMVYGLLKVGCFDEATDVIFVACMDIDEMIEKGLSPAVSGFGLGETLRKAIEVFYPQD